MQKVSFRRNVFLLLLLAVLARPVEAAASPLDLFERFWTFVQSALSESGSQLDPDGTPAPQNDEGPELDPNGPPAPQTDEGSQLDPDG